jgi:hypothetical protein
LWRYATEQALHIVTVKVTAEMGVAEMESLRAAIVRAAFRWRAEANRAGLFEVKVPSFMIVIFCMQHNNMYNRLLLMLLLFIGKSWLACPKRAIRKKFRFFLMALQPLSKG